MPHNLTVWWWTVCLCERRLQIESKLIPKPKPLKYQTYFHLIYSNDHQLKSMACTLNHWRSKYLNRNLLNKFCKRKSMKMPLMEMDPHFICHCQWWDFLKFSIDPFTDMRMFFLINSFKCLLSACCSFDWAFPNNNKNTFIHYSSREQSWQKQKNINSFILTDIVHHHWFSF